MNKLHEDFIKEGNWIKYDGSGRNPVDASSIDGHFQIMYHEELNDGYLDPDLYSSIPNYRSEMFFPTDKDLIAYYKLYDHWYDEDPPKVN